MYDPDAIDVERDLPAIRTFDLGDNELRIAKDPVRGFFSLSLRNGQLPKFMHGQFTSIDDAMKVVNLYIGQRAEVVDRLRQKAKAEREKRQEKKQAQQVKENTPNG